MNSGLCEIKITLPADILFYVRMNEEQLAMEIRRMLAFRLFSEGRISLGKAAKLSGISKITFLSECGKREIDILSYSEDELRRELG